MMWLGALAGPSHDQLDGAKLMDVEYQPLPPAAVLWEMLDYSPFTGELFWRQDRADGFVKAGMRAGSYKHKSGYVFVFSRFWGRHKIHAGRIVWKWVTGEDPGQYRVDHADLNKHNNRWGNLRLADAQQSTWNRPRFHFSKGKKLLGVYPSSENRWRARIRLNGQNIHLGTFDSPEAAHAAYCEAAQPLRGEFWRPG